MVTDIIIIPVPPAWSRESVKDVNKLAHNLSLWLNKKGVNSKVDDREMRSGRKILDWKKRNVRPKFMINCSLPGQIIIRDLTTNKSYHNIFVNEKERILEILKYLHDRR